MLIQTKKTALKELSSEQKLLDVFITCRINSDNLNKIKQEATKRKLTLSQIIREKLN